MSDLRFDDCNWIAVKNVGSQTIPSFGVMRITGVSKVEGRPVVTVDRPNGDLQRQYLINDFCQIKADGFGRGTFDAYFALTESGTPAYGEGWGVQANSFKLTQGNPGFTAIGGAEEDRAIFQPETIWSVIGKLDEDIALGGSGTVSVWGTGDSGLNIEATDWVSNGDDDPLKEGAMVLASWVGPFWSITSAGNCGKAEDE